MSKYYNFTKFCYLCNSNKSHTNQNVIIQLTKNTAYILYNSSISLTDLDGQLMGLILHKGSFIKIHRDRTALC